MRDWPYYDQTLYLRDTCHFLEEDEEEEEIEEEKEVASKIAS